MARTFNRAPLSVPTPSKNDLQEYFFTNNNFKGLSNDKNFLTVDQETFSNCNNVYVDSEGLLKSRPALKNESIVVTLSNGNVTLSNVLDVWTYDKVTVYHTNDRLTFVNNDFQTSVQISLLSDVKLILAENKIFIFEPNSIRYYDMDTNKVSTKDECISKYIYTPVTKIVKNGVIEELESENELTTSYSVRYLFDNITDSNFGILVGKTVTIKLDNVEYDITFVNDNEQVFVQKLSEMTFDYTNVSISDVSSMIIVEESSDSSYRIYYSTNGKTFTVIDTLDNAMSIPTLSMDGQYICYPAETEIYVYQVLDTEGTGSVTGEWEPLLSKLSLETYTEWTGWGLSFYSVSFVKMLAYDTFATICKFNNDIYCITSHLGVLSRYCISAYNYIATSTLRTEQYTIDISGGYGDYTIPITGFKYTADDVIIWETLSLSLNYSLKGLALTGKVNYATGDDTSTSLPGKTVDVNYSSGLISFTFKAGEIDVSVSLSTINNTVNVIYNQNLNPLRLDWGYPLGASFASFSAAFYNTANIDMYANASQFFVAINAGEICAIDPNCEIRVRYIARPWEQDFKPQDYGIAITSSELYFTAPSNIGSNYTSLYTYKYRAVADLTTSNGSIGFHKYNKYSVGQTLKSTVSSTGRVLTDKNLYLSSATIPLLFEATPIKVTNNGIYLSKDGIIYSSALEKVIEVNEVVSGVVNYIVPDYIAEIDSFYFISGKTLYISSYPADGEFKWYFPKITTEQFDYEISNIHPISATEMAVFLEDSVYYIQRSEQGYLYYKSKIQVGCRKGSSIITTFDGKYIVFASTRGLVALSYQDFVASTEQTLTYLSDAIHDVFKAYNDNPIQLFKYDFWILCYKQDSDTFLLFDIRNNSWWPMELSYPINKFFVNSDVAKILCDGKIYTFTYDDYYDFDGVNKSDVDWYFTSQKLHLNAPNYYKHISNITLTSVLDSDEDIYLDLTLYNYRKKIHQSEVESFKFNVDSIRTYVKRLNYSKVNEFQYLLTSNINDAADEEEALNVPKVPLSLSSITVKYKISGQVR